MGEYLPSGSDWYLRRNLDPPSSTVHGTEEDVRQKLTQLKPARWRQEANWIIGVTEQGHEVAQQIPSNYLLTGTDEQGLPILKKL